MQTLAWAHHDGSALYAPDSPLAVGDRVTLRLRAREDSGVDRVWLRTVRDGEPHYSEATRDGARNGEQWFAVDIDLHNPTTSYRFLTQAQAGATSAAATATKAATKSATAWINGSGIWDRDVTDAHDFRLVTGDHAPAWLRDAVVYQVFPDRFAPHPAGGHPTGGHGPGGHPTSELPAALPAWAVPRAWNDTPAAHGPHTGREIFGGTLAGIESRLAHLIDLGVTTLYLTPFFPAGSNHRYDASTFDRVDPLLGGDAALAALTRAAHARGLRVMGDLTTNHTGATHEWFIASQDPTSPESRHYLWNDAHDDYVGWLGHRSLPKLNWQDPALMERMVTHPRSAVRRWLDTPYDLDGWRIDVANMTGRYGAVDVNARVAQAIRESARSTRPDAAIVGEHFHDATDDLRRGSWDATMNYAGFMRPAWQWLSAPESTVPYLDAPITIPHRAGGQAQATMRDVLAGVPWAVAARAWNLLATHDSARLRTVTGGAQRHRAAATLLYAYPGAPFVFAGDEGGLEGSNGEHSRTPMPWEAIDSGGPGWDHATHAHYRALGAVRRHACALRHGGLRWVATQDDALAFLRECAHETLLVAIARDASTMALTGADPAEWEPLLDSEISVRAESGRAKITVPGAASQIWRIHPSRPLA